MPNSTTAPFALPAGAPAAARAGKAEGGLQRVGLARAIVYKPEIILYDEPTTGLDPITAREISELMVSMQKKYNATSVIISHDMNCIRITSNRVIMLIEGRRYADDTYENLRLSKDPKIREFFD